MFVLFLFSSYLLRERRVHPAGLAVRTCELLLQACGDNKTRRDRTAQPAVTASTSAAHNTTRTSRDKVAQVVAIVLTLTSDARR